MLRYFLPVYLLVYFGTAFFLPTFRVWRKTKINPLVLGNSDDARDYIGRVFKIVMVMIAIVVLIYSFAPQFYEFLMPIRILERTETQIVGIALLLLSLGWTILAQIQMGNSWRIGIDQKQKTNLVRSGVFGVSRNPIFLRNDNYSVRIVSGFNKRLHAFNFCSRFCFDSNSSSSGRRVFDKYARN